MKHSEVDPFFLDLREGHMDAELRQTLLGKFQPYLGRSVGVVYIPERDRQSYYSRASLPEQFDGWVWFYQTRAVQPFETA